MCVVQSSQYTIDQFWPLFFDDCVQFVQLTTVNIRIDRFVPWKQLKKYHKISSMRKIESNLKFYRTSTGKSTFRTQNYTVKANFRCTAHKKYFFPISRSNPLFDPPIGKKLYVTQEKLFHQTSHSLNKLFFPSCTIYYFPRPVFREVITLSAKCLLFYE